MPHLEITQAEIDHHLAMLARTHEVRRKLRAPFVPRVRVELVAPPVKEPPPPHLGMYAFPIGPVFVPAGSNPLYNPNKPLTRPRDVIADVARLAGLSPADILTRSRRAEVMRPRHLAIWRIAQECKPISLPQVGRYCGGRDHTTALHSIRVVERAIADGKLDPSDPLPWFQVMNRGRS